MSRVLEQGRSRGFGTCNYEGVVLAGKGATNMAPAADLGEGWR
jgi:hypothetical protein